VVEMLAAESGPPEWQEAIQRGLDWLSGHQEPDGSYWGRWGVNYIYGTGAVLPALIAAGVPAKDPRVADGARWLIEHQNTDGTGLARPGGLHRLADGLGADRPPGSRGARPPRHRKGRRLARAYPDGGGDLGRTLVHGHGFPVGFLPELPPLPPCLPAHCARSLLVRYRPSPPGRKAMTG
jgi:hypothetical protein